MKEREKSRGSYTSAGTLVGVNAGGGRTET